LSAVAILSEGLPGDLRPIGYSRSTWDVPFLAAPLLVHALAWLERRGIRHIVLLDDTPGLWLQELSARCPSAIPLQPVDARPGRADHAALLRDLLQSPGSARVLHLKPCALLDPEMANLECFHEASEAQATFALTRLEPGNLAWPYIPACRMDEFGSILEVDKLRRTETLGSATLENVLGAPAPSRPREYWAPRNVSILEAELALDLPVSELLAPLAGLARKLASGGVPCYGQALKGRWWPASSALEVLTANREALRATGGDANRFDADSRIDPTARVADDVRVRLSIVGPEAMVGPGAELEASVLSSGVAVGSGAVVRDSLLGPGAAVPEGLRMSGSVVGDGEVQNLMRGVPPGGFFLDGLRSVDESSVVAYWKEHVPLLGRGAGAAILGTLTRGIDNNVYHLFDGRHHFVVKRRLDCNAHPLLREFHVLRALGGLASPRFAPRPYLLDLRPEIKVAPCIVMEFVAGTDVPLGAITPALAASIGRTCLEVHGLPIDGLLRDLPELAEQAYPDLLTYVSELVFQYNCYLDSRDADDALGENLGSLVKWLEEMAERENAHWTGYVPRALCQGDLREFNMRVREDDADTVVLLDWERCGIDDPAYDVGWFLALANLGPEAETAFREAYGPGLPGDRSFWARVEAFRLADVLTWPVHLLALARECREQRAALADPESQARRYEDDAVVALADAFTALARVGVNGFRACSADSIRGMGRLFA
jgi:aminoglycoside phosphotransferase (APT) family kinase protein